MCLFFCFFHLVVPGRQAFLGFSGGVHWLFKVRRLLYGFEFEASQAGGTWFGPCSCNWAGNDWRAVFPSSMEVDRGAPARKVVFQHPIAKFHDCWGEGRGFLKGTKRKLFFEGVPKTWTLCRKWSP